MRIFAGFLKERAREILLYIITLALLKFVFFLYNLPSDVLNYGFLLVLVLAGILFFIDFFFFSVFLLKNKNNRSDVIPYQILKTSEATPFVSARYHTAGEATPLTISIKQDDWNKAPSGDYSDTVTFTISYVDDK